jgi:ABC-type xylose transport system permease subunit
MATVDLEKYFLRPQNLQQLLRQNGLVKVMVKQPMVPRLKQ